MSSPSIRRPSDAYSTTKMTFLKPNEKNGNGMNGNGTYSEDTRSASVKVRISTHVFSTKLLNKPC